MNLKQKLAIQYVRARLRILSLVSPERAAKKAFDLFCTPRRKSRRRLPPLFGKSNDCPSDNEPPVRSGEKLSFPLGGHTIRGHRWLPHQASSNTLKKVMILHGFESSSRNFEQYINALLKKGYEVLAFDAPGHGQSDGRRITVPLYMDMIRAVYDKHGPIHSFMGHSLGALALGLFLASVAHDATTRVVLIAPAVEATAAVDRFFQLVELNDEVRTAFDAYGYSLYNLPFSWFSLRRALRQIKAGVLWVQDEDDPITPLKDALPVREDGHPHVRWLLTKGLGHRKIYRDKDVMRQVVDFL